MNHSAGRGARARARQRGDQPLGDAPAARGEPRLAQRGRRHRSCAGARRRTARARRAAARRAAAARPGGRPTGSDGRAASAARRTRSACRSAVTTHRPAARSRAGAGISARQAEARRERCDRRMPASNSRADPRLAGGAEPRAQAGSRISRASAAASARGSPGGTSTPVAPSSISSAMPDSRVDDAGEALALRLDQHIGQAVAVAVAARSWRRARRDRPAR